MELKNSYIMDIASYFRFMAASLPDNTALAYKGENVTYRDLDEQSDRIASALAGHLPPHRPVGVAMRRSPLWTTVMLGIWKAGGIYVPLDPGNPDRRLEAIIADCGISLVVKDSDTGFIPRTVPTCMADNLLRAGMRPLDATADENSPAYIIYTSGTTGIPKGVATRHRQAVVMGRLGSSKLFHVRPGTRMLQLAGLSYSASLVETMTCLLNGGCMVMATEEERHHPNKLFALLERERVESAFIPPTLLGQMPQGELPCLKTLVVAGESVSQDTKDYWMTGRRMVNAYGFTENTVLVTGGVYAAGTKAHDIGTPLPGVRAYVLDENLAPVRPGTEGELCISGRQLADGYWNSPGLSESKFIPNPFATEQEKKKGHAMLYRSGDRVLCQPDGRYLYLGRTDGQVKIRGARVETGEIEQCLNHYPGVEASAVLLKEHDGRKELVAYLQTGHGPDSQAIAAYVQERLPAHMRPVKYVALKKFPLTLNQKTDKARLPEPDWSHTDATAAPPATPTEEKIAEVWRKMLGVETVGREDDFIVLGGDSISVMLMADELEKAFGIQTDTAELYRRKKLSALAEYMDGKLAEKAKASGGDGTGAYEPPAPLGNLLVDCLSSEERNAAYKLAVFIPWDKDLDVPALQDAWNRITQEQDAMRIFFQREQDGKHRVHTAAHHAADIPVKEIHTDDFPDEAAGLYRQPLDPERPPLHRECLYRLSDGSYILTLVIHHLITDGWSLRLLARTLKAYCRKEGNGAGQGCSYREYARWYRQRLEAPVTKEKLDFWRSYLSGCPELSLAGNLSKTNGNGPQGCALTLPMDPQSVRALNRFCREHSATPFAVCLCVYQILLTKYAGQADFAVGAAFTDRRTSELHHTMGYLTTLLPVRTVPAASHFADMVERMSRNIPLLSGNSLPLDMIGNCLEEKHANGTGPLVRFVFGLEDMPTPLDVPDEWTTASPFDLSLSVYRRGSDYSYHYQYAADCFDTAFLTAFSESFDAALLYLTAHPEKDMRTCPLLPPHKMADIAAAFRIGPSARPRPDVVTSFEETAEARPDREASVWNGQRTSYGELQGMSGRVAAAIRRRLNSVDGQPVPIGIRLQEKRHLPAGILGILKSGNSYVPLDAGLPQERLEFILKDAGIRLVLCDTPLTGEGLACLTMEEALAYNGEKTPPVRVRPEATAYIIYTSGTTGQPKGTPVSHASLALFAESQSGIFNLQAESRVLQYANMGFDASVLEIFPALLSGSTLVMPTETERKDADRLLGLLESENVSHALIPPALLALLPYRSLPCLRVLVVGGESTPEDVMVKWAQGRTLLNEYGPTENTVVTTCAAFTAGCRPDNIGQPLPGVSCYVVDKDMNLMPDGVAGELCIGGLQLTGGYLHRDTLNREKFVENSFALPEDKARGVNTRLYRSGDKAARTADGSFLYLGRMDSQVKLRGFRIELDGIARQLERHPDVLQALAVLKKTENGHPYIAAYVVAREDSPTLPEELARHLRTRLPAYMVPTAWRTVPGFPLTLNGKIDKAALPEPFLYATGLQVPPSNEEEAVLADIASKLLEMEQVGVTTDLFDLGLTSLQAMELVFDAREQGIFISATDLYKGRRIRDILAGRKGDYFHWQGHPGRTGKPMMVLIGYPSFTPHYDAFVRLFGEDYDIFVLESFTDTLQGAPGCNAGELVKHYRRIVLRESGGKGVSVVAGYCLGGEIAMLLAEALRKDGQPQVRALVIDSFLFRDKQLPLNGGNADGAGEEYRRILSEIIRSLPQPEFGGDMAVCLTSRPYKYRTEDGETRELPGIQQRNREDWKRTYPHALYCEVDADHDSVFEERYMTVLHEAVKRHWQDETAQREDGHEE